MKFGECNVEKETSERPARQVVLLLERRNLLGSEWQRGKAHRGRWRRGVEDTDGEEESRVRAMKQGHHQACGQGAVEGQRRAGSQRRRGKDET